MNLQAPPHGGDLQTVIALGSESAFRLGCQAPDWKTVSVHASLGAVLLVFRGLRVCAHEQRRFKLEEEPARVGSQRVSAAGPSRERQDGPALPTGDGELGFYFEG